MSLFRPDAMVKRVTDITPEILKKLNCKGIILDVDNTLSTHGHHQPIPGAVEWVSGLVGCGFSVIILSNNTHDRVEPFAGLFPLEFVSRGKKPLPSGFYSAIRHMNLTRYDTIVVGDQLFTDILGAKLAGLKSILVEPIEMERERFLAFKRILERPILKRLKK